MDILTKNYLAYVCSYFHLRKKIQVRKELSQELKQCAHRYKNTEDLLLHYGHPKSVAYTMGYRPLISRSFDPELVNRFTYTLLLLFDIFLLISSFVYLDAFGYIPNISLYTLVVNHPTVSLFFQHPLFTLGVLICLFLIIFVIADMSQKNEITEDLSWNEEKLHAMPNYHTYSHHLYESLFMVVFVVFFIVFGLFFIANFVHYNRSAYNQIRLIFYFVQPYVGIIFLSFLVDLTKRNYEKNYLILSFITNLLTFIPVNIAFLRSHFLTDFMLPIAQRSANSVINTFVIMAVGMIEFIIIFKLIKNAFNLFRLYLPKLAKKE